MFSATNLLDLFFKALGIDLKALQPAAQLGTILSQRTRDPAKIPVVVRHQLNDLLSQGSFIDRCTGNCFLSWLVPSLRFNRF